MEGQLRCRAVWGEHRISSPQQPARVETEAQAPTGSETQALAERRAAFRPRLKTKTESLNLKLHQQKSRSSAPDGCFLLKGAGLAGPVSHRLLSWRRGSVSSLSPVGVAGGPALTAVTARAYPGLWAEPALASSAWCCSGMKTATKRATITVHAPNRKGGPGMSNF